ncbi:MAG: alpha/beta hydrolase [Clostridia bacterium]|nr:alpha/beta hydrolase [Clostridia bacterium]
MLKEILTERKLPELLKFNNGTKVETKEDWEKRRKEIFSILESEIYGTPVPFRKTEYEVTAEEWICAGKGIHTSVKLSFPEADGFSFPIEILRPRTDKKVPVFVFLNFRPDLYDRYLPTEEIIDNGFAVARIYYQDVTTDDGDFSSGIAKYAVKDRSNGTDCGKIAMWAWSASRVLDYLESTGLFDTENAAVMGHSRLGKTALLAGAYDERFKFVMSNDSGCSGAAITRDKVGERVDDICRNFPYWFCENYFKYRNAEDTMPFDQHFLVSLSAPRFVSIHSAIEDKWADPDSEFLTCVATSEVYNLFSKKGFVYPDRLPVIGDDLTEGNIGYSLRSGSHFLSRWDWNKYMSFIREKI